MKKILALAFVFLSIIGLYSCSDDFNVAAPYKNITLVYGLLNTEDTAHYIIVKKAFMDEHQNAVDMAKVADSNYYPNLDVYVRVMSGSTITKTITLSKVDLVNEGYTKDTGTFYTSPNYAYKFTDKLDPAYKYRLVVHNPDADFTDSSEVEVLDGSKLYSTDFQSTSYQLNFQRMNNKLTILFFAPSNVAFVEAKLTFRWVDKDVTTGTQTDHSADFTAFTYPEFPLSQSTFTVKTLNTNLYYFLNSAMGEAPANIERYIDSCDFTIAAAPLDLYNYMVVLDMQSTGLTADQIKPIYTNIIGKDVYGIFSSRVQVTYENYQINPATLDSLIVNPITVNLNIKGRSDH